jgi:YD repeat-containing protein
LPQSITSKKDTGLEEVKVKFNRYDEFGNVLELQQESGILISYIYGYNKTLPIAKIENATYLEVQQYEANIQTLSNGTNESLFVLALNNLRAALPNAMITTYTHKPLIGVTTITDPKGDTITYTYDSFGRLQYVTDKNGNKLSENQYNYKP